MDDVSVTKRPLTPKFLRLLRNNLNKDYLKSYNGFLKLAQLVSDICFLLNEQHCATTGESVALFMILNWANSSLHKGCSHVVDYSTAQVRLTHDATPIDRLSVTLLYLYVFLAQFGHLFACSLLL